MRRSTEGPSTVVSPSNSIPSSTKNAFAASRSSTTMRTLSIRRIVMGALLLRHAARHGHWCTQDGASATLALSDGHSVISLGDAHWRLALLLAHPILGLGVTGNTDHHEP